MVERTVGCVDEKCRSCQLFLRADMWVRESKCVSVDVEQNEIGVDEIGVNEIGVTYMC